MNDDHVIADLDEFLDERLSAERYARIQAHLAGCAECRAQLESAKELRAVLSALPVAGPSPEFFDRAMRKAKAGNSRLSSQRSVNLRGPAALAAGLAVILIGGFLLRQPDTGVGVNAPTPVAANITMTLEESKIVNLVFQSENLVEDVMLTVDLPLGVELAAYPGRMQMRWVTSLQAGRNRLPLELIAVDGVGGEIIATMRSEDTEKVFRIDVEVEAG